MCAFVGTTLLLTTPTFHGQLDRFYIWNVGQGQWATWVQAQRCLHFDMGGEFSPLKKIKNICQHKDNFLFLSHSDYDHMKYVSWGMRQLPNFCLAALPRESLNAKKRKALQNISVCAKLPTEVIELHTPTTADMDANSQSRVYIAKGRMGAILIPGDSTQSAEKKWIPLLKQHSRDADVRFLILGHHGSRTSTSNNLLENLPQLQVALCSSRKRRYGHPHAIVSAKIQKRLAPLLITEIWGSLAFDF